MSRSHDETSEALLQAAQLLLAESGTEALTVRRIATMAGMSTMNVYSRFGGKLGVIDELYADGFRRLGAAIDAIPVTGDTLADLEQIARAYREFALQNPAYYDIMFGSSVPGFDPSTESIEIGVRSLTGLVDRITAACDNGSIVAPEGSNPADLAAWLWATCHGLVSLELDQVATEYVIWSSVFERGIQTSIRALRPVTTPSA